MQQACSHARRRAIAAAFFVSLPAWAMPPAAQADDPQCVYSVINMGQDGSASALLNERGQAAFGAVTMGGVRNGFFDGEYLHPVGTLGGSYSWVWGLNNLGVVSGESEDGDEHSNILGFAWTAGAGMRALAGSSVSSARAINDRGHIVGLTPAPGISARAVRWNRDASVTPLGPLPLSLSEAFAINSSSSATGFADTASGAIHATLWDRGGNLTDLGTLGGTRAFGMHINAAGAVAGESDDAGDTRTVGFFWSRNSGMLAIPVEGGGARLVAGLNNRGEVVGVTTIGARSVAYQWSLARGVVELPSGSAPRSDVFDINNYGAMVGLAERPAADGGGLRAMRWPGLASPVDLNTRLHRPPAGLVLEAGMAINDSGVILAHSNAGLVMLRPGRRGTDAPVLGPLQGLPEVLELGQELTLTLSFADHNSAQTHSASALWSDGCASPPPALRQARGAGQVRLQHRFCAAGFHTLALRVADSGGRSTLVQREFLVEAPASLSGKGTLASAAQLGRSYRNVPLQFAVWAPAFDGGAKAASHGVVTFSGPFHFRSEQLTRTVGAAPRVEGTGRLNGRAGYRFVLEGAAQRLRLRVTHRDARSGAEVADYDSGAQMAQGALRLR